MQPTPIGDIQQPEGDEAGPSHGSHMFVFSNSKAGMKDVDKEKVNRVIYEMSKNSSYFKQAQLQDKKLDLKVIQNSNARCEFVIFPSAFPQTHMRALCASRYVCTAAVHITRSNNVYHDWSVVTTQLGAYLSTTSFRA